MEDIVLSCGKPLLPSKGNGTFLVGRDRPFLVLSEPSGPWCSASIIMSMSIAGRTMVGGLIFFLSGLSLLGENILMSIPCLMWKCLAI